MSRPFLIVAILLTGCGPADSDATDTPASRAPTAVRAEPLATAPASDPIVSPGRLARSAERTLAFRAAGYIANIAVDVGDQVGRGTVLATLSALDVDAARAAAQADADRTQRTVERFERLYADSVVPLAQLEDARDAAARAAAALDAAADAAERSVLRAPTAGRISARMVEADEWVGPGDPVFSLAAGSTWTVDVALTDRDALRVGVGDPARITSEALPGRILNGAVSRVGGGADPRTGTFPVEVTLDPSEIELRSGLVVRVEITPTATSAPALAAPPEALVDASAGRGVVFVVDADTARARPVEVLSVGANTVRIRATDLTAGTSIVTTGAAYLRDGDPVRVVDTGPGADR